MEWSIHYIDDFLTAGPPNSGQCQTHLNRIVETCQELGFPLKDEKVEGPTRTITFLGIVRDSVKMEIRLPDDKAQELIATLEQWADKRKCRNRELLSLIGKLAHACKVVRVGRLFLRRMIELASRAKRIDHWVHLNMGVPCGPRLVEGLSSSLEQVLYDAVNRPCNRPRYNHVF